MIENIPKFDTIIPNVLTVCTYTEFAPFSYDEQGEIVGSDIVLLKLFAEEMGLGINIIKRAFEELWHTPGKGDCDIAAAGMMEREERSLGVNGVWSRSYMLVKRSLLIRKTDSNVLKGPKDFVDKKIVVTPESTAHIDANERYEHLGANIIPVVPSQDEIVRQILDHKVDAFGEGTLSNEYLANKYVDEYGNPLLVLADIHEMKIPETLQFAIRSKDKNLAICLNAFIATYEAPSKA